MLKTDYIFIETRGYDKYSQHMCLKDTYEILTKSFHMGMDIIRNCSIMPMVIM